MLAHGVSRIRNEDVRARLEPVARKVSFSWLQAATARVDELVELVRRNIQKSIALDAFAAGLKPRL
jgi:DNA polymerase-3 subunit delta'